MKQHKKHRSAVLSAVIALSLILGLAMGASAAGKLGKDEISAIIDTDTDQTLVTSPLISVANTARESVVGINNYQTTQQTFFGYGYGYYTRPSEPKIAGTGSGVMVTAYGHVLTNYHVVENAAHVTVTSDGKEYDAAVVGSDSELDIAILQVPGLDLPVAPLGNSDSLQIGEWAIVIGNPLGQEFERTVTVGVVSALDREIKDSSVDRYGRRYMKTNQMIQVDAAISSGNSGGGMFNILGQLQGIPTLKFDSNRGGSIIGFSSGPSIDNIGMCIPINAAKPLLQSVLEDYQGDAAIEGKQAAEADKPKPRIGVTIKTLPPSHPLVADQSLPQGAYVVEVVEGEPADLAGIKVGDIIVEGNGEIIRSSTDLVMFVESSKDGDAIEMKLFRAEGLADIIDGKANPDILGEGEYITVEVHPVITNLDM